MQSPRFWYSERSFLSFCMRPFGMIYSALVFLKEFFSSPPLTSPIPLICVGNLTVGGTGKTPICLELGKFFLSQNYRVCFLSRGYKGSLKGPLQVNKNYHSAHQVGDEPLLLSALAPTWISKDKREALKVISKKNFDLILMDDGHQNIGLRKSLSIVVVDGERGFGNGLILPAGPLRENKYKGCRKADIFIIMGKARRDLLEFLKGFQAPIFQGMIESQGISPDNEQKYYAFCGIGQPQNFFSSLKKQGLTLSGQKAYSDHHSFSKKDWDYLCRESRCKRSRLITTEKDWVRLPKKWRELVSVSRIGVKWKNGEKFESFLKEKIHEFKKNI